MSAQSLSHSSQRSELALQSSKTPKLGTLRAHETSKLGSAQSSETSKPGNTRRPDAGPHGCRRAGRGRFIDAGSPRRRRTCARWSSTSRCSGNTHADAAGLAHELRAGEVGEAVPVAGATTRRGGGGSGGGGRSDPRHGMARSHASGRAETADKPDTDHALDPDAEGPGLREWFDAVVLPAGRPAAAFDTRMNGPAVLTGAPRGGSRSASSVTARRWSPRRRASWSTARPPRRGGGRPRGGLGRGRRPRLVPVPSGSAEYHVDVVVVVQQPMTLRRPCRCRVEDHEDVGGPGGDEAVNQLLGEGPVVGRRINTALSAPSRRTRRTSTSRPFWWEE